MNSIKNSNPITRKRLEEIAYWIEADISTLSNKEAYQLLLKECELMYSEAVKVISGKKSLIYPELNTYSLETIEKCKNITVLLNIELEVSCLS